MLAHRSPGKFEVLGDAFVAPGAIDRMNDVANLVISLLCQDFHVFAVPQPVRKLLDEVGKGDAQPLGLLVLIGGRAVPARVHDLTASQNSRNRSTRFSGGFPAMSAALIAPIEIPATQSGCAYQLFRPPVLVPQCTWTS
jgi:hypothetical protein